MKDFINKEFKQLSIKEKYKLQKIMKQKRNGDALNENEQALFNRFSNEFKAAEGEVKSKWPIIIALLIVSLFAIVRKCQ